ncbi:MAG: hypothetical protein GDA52_10155 [Rhodobacteraceae bacterium]|nr:hypothetical protein [Paracoccaceae bacterium]
MHWLLDASDKPCQESKEGATALAYARDNPAFNQVNPSGELQDTPRDRLLALCS